MFFFIFFYYFFSLFFFFFFFFNDTATTEIYTLSLHDALPISRAPAAMAATSQSTPNCWCSTTARSSPRRSEEHTSELQSPCNIVCRLLLEKKKKKHILNHDQQVTVIKKY